MVGLDCLLDEVGVEAPGHHPDADEGGQQGAGLELGRLGECVEAEQPQEVAQGLG